MILSEVIFNNAGMGNIFKMSIDEIHQIIKTEDEIDRFIKKQSQTIRRDKIE